MSSYLSQTHLCTKNSKTYVQYIYLHSTILNANVNYYTTTYEKALIKDTIPTF